MAIARVNALVRGARRLVDPEDPLGAAARAELPESTGLSPAGVELGLTRCLETQPSDADVRALVHSVPRAPRALVLLSANVFVAAHRAIALALAASEEVVVRPSRREPLMARLLERAAPGLFRISERLDPGPGDHLWAYGEGETLASLEREIPDGVTLHRHGPGIGVAFVAEQKSSAGRVLREAADALAEDVVVFDQRGCLSPRVVFVLAEPPGVRAFADLLARALRRAAVRVPPGRLSPDELADRSRYRDTMLVAKSVHATEGGVVGLDVDGGAVVVPPVGRCVHVMRCADPDRVVTDVLRAAVTTVGVEGSEELAGRVAELFPRARVTRPGAMQTPPFNGPVDLRPA